MYYQQKKEGVLLNKRHQRIFDKIDEEVTHSWDSQFGYSILKKMGGARYCTL